MSKQVQFGLDKRLETLNGAFVPNVSSGSPILDNSHLEDYFCLLQLIPFLVLDEIVHRPHEEWCQQISDDGDWNDYEIKVERKFSVVFLLNADFRLDALVSELS